MVQHITTTKHYEILDGLRGVAALLVLFYHLNEAIAFSAGAAEQKFFHGYLGVDFFFILSGFVMGYAYDGRWDRMTVGNFIKRRLIRLHPMVVMGVLIGLASYIIQGCINWSGETVAIGTLMLTTLLALFLLPVTGSLDVRGNTEAFPLNGPHWSLFFEYLGSLAYALFLHKLSTKVLKIWVSVSLLLLLAVNLPTPEAGIGYGWSSEAENLLRGSLRIIYAYPMGLLLSRIFHEKSARQSRLPQFAICSITLVLLMSVPSLTSIHPQLKVVYEIICVGAAFPLIVWNAAKGEVAGRSAAAVRFLGRLSYPLYAVHYPFIYLYIHWINTDAHPFGTWEYATPVAVAIISIAVAAACTILYDEPVRRWLTKRFLSDSKK